MWLFIAHPIKQCLWVQSLMLRVGFLGNLITPKHDFFLVFFYFLPSNHHFVVTRYICPCSVALWWWYMVSEVDFMDFLHRVYWNVNGTFHGQDQAPLCVLKCKWYVSGTGSGPLRVYWSANGTFQGQDQAPSCVLKCKWYVSGTGSGPIVCTEM